MEANAGPMTNLKRALDGLRDHCRARRYPALFSFMLLRREGVLWARDQLFGSALIGREVFTRFHPWERGELDTKVVRRWRCSWFDFCDSAARLAAKSELMLRRIGGRN
jgi:hypothetical protein